VRAVVLAPSVEALAGPGLENAALFTLHEGATVDVRAEREGWFQVALPNGASGWVERRAAERI
jgi:SH3-like domain-containing protein